MCPNCIILAIMWNKLISDLQKADTKALARCISLIENEVEAYENGLASLVPKQTPIIGISGPSGAGKNTLVDALIGLLVTEGKAVAVICVHPSYSFNFGALPGDRIRMIEWYNNLKVFIVQSEVEIAGLCDVTVIVLVPEAGDEIQTMKAA